MYAGGPAAVCRPPGGGGRRPKKQCEGHARLCRRAGVQLADAMVRRARWTPAGSAGASRGFLTMILLERTGECCAWL